VAVRGAAIACAALSLGALSCGLASSGARDEAPRADGTSGFGAAEPIEICLGAARVVSPATAAVAASSVCVPEDSIERACASDAACDAPERCLCGRCIVRACEGAAACGAGEVCRAHRCTRACGADGDCAADERCASGGCARACGADAECHHGEACDPLGDVCVTKTCGAGLPCGAARRCEDEEVVRDAREPEVALLDGAGVVFVEMTDFQGRPAVYRARVVGPLRWIADPIEPVLAAPDEGGVGAPSVVARGGAIELYAALGDGAALVRATSSDGGATFTRDAAPVLEPAEGWEAGFVGSPAVFEREGATYLAYAGGRGAGIGLARVGAAGAERLTSAPVITPAALDDSFFWRGVTRVGAPYARVSGDVVRLYLTARGAEGSDAITSEGALPADVNDSIGLVATTDLASFSPFPTGPVYARVANLRAYLGERDPAVRAWASGAELYFVASDASGERTTGLARALAGPAAP
jgi:hypothetical protein